MRKIIPRCKDCSKRETLIRQGKKREEYLRRSVNYYKAVVRIEKHEKLRNIVTTLGKINELRNDINCFTADVKRMGGKKQYYNYTHLTQEEVLWNK